MFRVLLLHPSAAALAAWGAVLARCGEVAVAGASSQADEARRLLARDDHDLVLLAPDPDPAEPFALAAALRPAAQLVFLVPDPRQTAAFAAAGVEHIPDSPGPEALATLFARLRQRTEAESLAAAGPLIAVRDGARTRLLRPQDIRFVAAHENYTEVTLNTGKRLLARRPMSRWGALIPQPPFARAHRSLWVNLEHIRHTERLSGADMRLYFSDQLAAPLELKRRHWPALRARLEAWRQASGPVPTHEQRKSIAVLPFVNLSLDPANEVFADGVTEELLNLLARMSTLRVAARTSAFFFKGKSLPIPDIARQLGVEFVVEGSVRRAGDRVRVTVQLIHAADGCHRWSENFERESADVFALQDEIAALIASQLHLTLYTPPGAGRARPGRPEVRWLVLEGRHFWNLRTAEGFIRAEAAFARALALDPDFAPAHAGLADVCVVRGMYRLADGARDASDDFRRAGASARRALELDPGLAEPHAAEAFVALHEGRLADAENAFPRAFAANPSYATGYQFYAWTLCARGEMDRALAAYEKAIELDPLSFINLDRYAAMLALAGRFPEALAANERAASLRPDVFVGNLSQRGPILLALGRTDEAIAAARLVRRTARDAPFRRNSDADAVFVLHRAGFHAEAEDYAAEVLARLPTENYLRGFLLAAVGRFAEAIPQVECLPAIMLPQLYWSEIWHPFRAQPAFFDLIARLGRTDEYRRARRGGTTTP